MKLTKISKTLYGIGQFLNRSYLRKINMQVNDGVTEKLNNEPYLILANHSSVMDYRITSFLLRKNRPYHIAAKNQFAKRFRLMSKVGALPKVQFQVSPVIVKQIETAVKDGKSVVVFPEGVVSFDGTNRTLPFSVAKLIKFLHIPVAVMKIKGTYLIKPRFNEVFRKTDKVEVDFFEILSRDDVEKFSAEEIYFKLCEGIYFNVWQWNKDNNVKTHCKHIARDIDNLLYSCIECGGETVADDKQLVCRHCGMCWTVDEFYLLYSGEEKTDIHTWFEKQRAVMRKNLCDENFVMQSEARVEILDGYKGFKKVGKGMYTQTAEGVRFVGEISGKCADIVFERAKYMSAPVGNNFIEFTKNYVSYRFYFEKTGFAIKSAVAVEESFKLM